jgi:hypothetical protein
MLMVKAPGPILRNPPYCRISMVLPLCKTRQVPDGIPGSSPDRHVAERRTSCCQALRLLRYVIAVTDVPGLGDEDHILRDVGGVIANPLEMA